LFYGGALRGRCDHARSAALSYGATDQVSFDWPFDDEIKTLLRVVLEGANEKIAVDPVVLNLVELQDTFDALVVVSGRNDRQVRAIAEEIERMVFSAMGTKPLRVEGWASGEWIALDYGDIVVHIFDQETREYYDLEHLWSAAPTFRGTTPSHSLVEMGPQ
jgi:ribosome-associated protein